MHSIITRFKASARRTAIVPGLRRSQAIAVGQYGNWPALLCVDTYKGEAVGGLLPRRACIHAVFAPAFGN